MNRHIGTRITSDTMEALFSTVPEHNHLGLTDHPELVKKFLHFGEPDLASAPQVSRASLRHATSLPDPPRQRLVEIAIICERVAGHFGGDAGRTAPWFQTANPLLGG